MRNERRSREYVVAIARVLLEAYRSPQGLFEIKESDKPELVYTRGIPASVLPHFLMNVCVLDYNSSVEPLWRGARAAFSNPATSWIFSPPQVTSRGPKALEKAMTQASFLGRYPKQNVEAVYKVAHTITHRYAGSVVNLLRGFGFDAKALWESRKKLGALPNLTGPKIWPFFLRLLVDVANIPLKNLDRVPLPPDVHIIRSTKRLLLHDRGKPDQSKEAKETQKLWSELLEGSDIYPLMIDRALWVLSRYGCSGSDGKDECVKIDFCPVAKWCVFSRGGLQ